MLDLPLLLRWLTKEFNYLTWINFHVDKFSRKLTLKNFSWINFREWPGLKNLALIYFREDTEFEKYVSLKKRKMTLLSIKSFYKFTCLMGFDPLKRQKHYLKGTYFRGY